MRTVENRLARNYDRRSLVADMFSLHGNYDLARTWLDASQAEVIRAIQTIMRLDMAGGELLDRFRSCLLAERYLRRRQAQADLKQVRAA